MAALGATLGGGARTVTRRLLLGVDAGTTGVKAALFDDRLRPLRAANRRLVSHHPEPDWVEQDGEEHLRAVVEAVGEVIGDLDDEDEVVGCGLDHQGESVIAWDAETGRPLGPIVVWQCKRSLGIVERFQAEGHEPEIRGRCGLPLDPYFSAGKLTWLVENVPAVAAAVEAGTARMGTLDSFLCDRLGAGFATDPSTASRTQLADLRTGDWDPWLCERFGVPIAALPKVVDTVGSLGTLRHPDWNAELPLAARLVDQQAALAGAGCLDPGIVKATYGTGVFVLANLGADVPKIGEALLPTIAWRIGGEITYALDGGVFAAGSLLEWLASDLGIAEDPPAICALARELDGAGGVVVLPAITGLGAPWWKPEARGVIAGLTMATGRGHVARAALEGIAWRVADVLEEVRNAIDVRSLRADGGLSTDQLLMQLQADAIGIPVERMAVDSTARGAALLAGLGAGVFGELGEAGSLLEVEDRLEPTRDDAWRSAQYERWTDFVAAASEL